MNQSMAGEVTEGEGDMQSFEVCISQRADGSFDVSKEIKEESIQEPIEQEGGSAAAADIDEALEMARQMLQEGGMTEEESVMTGYNKAKPQGMAKPSPAKVFGEM